MKTNKQVILKSVILFAMVAFFTYLIIVVTGILMDTLGFSCDCTKYVSIGIAAFSAVFFSVCWKTTCSKR